MGLVYIVRVDLILNTSPWTVDAKLLCITLQKPNEKNEACNSVML
jgi:hypothetical protein